TNFVAIGVPSNVICDVSRKFVPETEMVNDGEPASAADGENPVTVGAGLTTLTLNPVDAPSGFEMIPLRVRGRCVWSALKLKAAVFPDTLPCVESNVAVVPAAKFAPSTVTVAAPEPAAIEGGVTLTIDGAAPAAVTLNGNETLAPLPGFET